LISGESAKGTGYATFDNAVAGTARGQMSPALISSSVLMGISNVLKFPYSVSRRAHSRRPRTSKNGTPEERAARAAAAAEELTSATVAEISSRSGDNQRLAKAAAAGPTLVGFLQHLRAYFVQEFARGKEINQIFDDLEGSYRRAEKALR